MVQIAWADASVQAAVISSVGTLLATVIAAICASIIGQMIANRKKLRQKLDAAYKDIDFLLEVEVQHCALHVERGIDSNKNRIRANVREMGLTWSGKNTPSRRRLT